MSSHLLRAARTFPVPLHRFNLPQFQAWSAGGPSQRAMASVMLRVYPRGFGVVSPQPMLWTHGVSAGGKIEEMPRPRKEIKFWELANQPNAETCECQNYVDHESKEPWGNRRRGHNAAATHHPFCQYDPAGAETFSRVHQENGWRAPKQQDAWSRGHDDQLKRVGLR